MKVFLQVTKSYSTKHESLSEILASNMYGPTQGRSIYVKTQTSMPTLLDHRMTLISCLHMGTRILTSEL